MRNGKLRFAAIAALAVVALTQAASAYYSPAMGRFLSRDPIDQPRTVLAPILATTTSFLPRDPFVRNEVVEASWLLSEPEPFGSRVIAAPPDWHLYAYVRNAPLVFVDPLGLCTCTVQVKASSKSGTSPGLHMYVYFKREGCGDDFTGAAHWGPCGFIGMCPKGSIDGKPYPNGSGSPGWGDDGVTANGGPPPQTHESSSCDSDSCTCLRDLMAAEYPMYLLLGPNSNSAAMEAARKCGVDTKGITGYPGQGISPGKPTSVG